MNNTIILQTTHQKQSEKILKWKQFGKLNIKTYPTLNFSKGVIKFPDLTLGFLEEIRHLKPQGVTCEENLHTQRNKNHRHKHIHTNI